MKHITKPSKTDLAQNDIANQMLKVWLQKLPSDRGLELTKTGTTSLNLVFSGLFNSDLDAWTQHVDSVAATTEFKERTDSHVLLDWTLEKLQGQLFDTADSGESNQ